MHRQARLDAADDDVHGVGEGRGELVRAPGGEEADDPVRQAEAPTARPRPRQTSDVGPQNRPRATHGDRPRMPLATQKLGTVMVSPACCSWLTSVSRTFLLLLS